MEINRKNLILYLSGQSISRIGSSILDFAIIWTIVLKFQDSIPFTISILLTYIPKILLGIIFDKFDFRLNQKTFMIIGDLFTAFISLLFLIINFENLKIIYFLIFLRAVGSGIHDPYSNSIIVFLFDEKYYNYVNSLNSLLKSSVSLIIPTITSLILTFVNIKYIIFIDFITAIINCAAVYCLKIINKKNKTEKRNKDKMPLSSVGSKILKINILFHFFMAVPAFMTALLVKYFFGDNIFYLNLNETFWSLGMIIGSVLSIKTIFKREFNIFSVSIISFGTTIILLSFSNNIILYILCITLSGISFPFYTVINNLIIQKKLDNLEVKNYYIKESMFINFVILSGIFICGFLSNIIKIDILFMLSGIMIIITGILAKKILYREI